VINARDAIKMDGRIAGTIVVEARPAHRGETRSLPRGDYCAIAVLDDGCGMDAATLRRAVEPFFTTKAGDRGTGLGLSMSHDIIVKQHGGQIDVDTRPGEFTEFIITLSRTLPAHDTIGAKT
jgi:signal transduction histidine kinase